MKEIFNELFSTDGFMRRWSCGNWTPVHGWMYILSNVAIGLAYIATPLILLIFIKKKKYKIPFEGIIFLFIAFIFMCGTTHITDAIMFWYPVYKFNALLLSITALISWATVIALIQKLPHLMSFKSPLQLEEIITERTKKLHSLNADLLKSQQETELLSHQKDEFISIASHELKTPLTSLRVMVQILKEETPDKKLLDSMDSQITKLIVLTNDLLDATKLQAGQTTDYTIEETHLFDVVKNAYDDLKITTTHKFTIINLSKNDIVKIDVKRISQVVANFITNAIKYSPDNSAIEIKLENKDDKIIVSVKDQGIGIPKEQQGKIFERFYRVNFDNSHTYPGLGLGLYISKEIIKKHKGDISFTSEEGKGSIFYFSLPVRR